MLPGIDSVLNWSSGPEFGQIAAEFGVERPGREAATAAEAATAEPA